MSQSKLKATGENYIPSNLVSFLSAMAVRNRYVQKSPDDPNTVIIGDDDQPTALTFPVEMYELAHNLRWVSTPSSDELARITRLGRDALRRHRLQRTAERAAATPQAASPPLRSATPSINPKESPLGWLASRRDGNGRPLLSQWEVEAGERLRADLERARLTPRITMSWSGIPMSGNRAAGPAGSLEFTDSTIAARTRVTKALNAVGPEFIDILIDVCGHLRGLEDISRSENWPRRAARLILQKALSALARHYGMIPATPLEDVIARRLRHWGTDDYRPSLQRWKQDTGQSD